MVRVKSTDAERMLTEMRISREFTRRSGISDKSPSAIMQEIAEEEGYSLEGIRKILIRNGDYIPRKDRED